MRETHPESVTPVRIARIVGEGGLWTRLDIAKSLKREKTTWVIENIERAVMLGYIDRLPGWAGKRACHVYAVPGEQLAFEDFGP